MDPTRAERKDHSVYRIGKEISMTQRRRAWKNIRCLTCPAGERQGLDEFEGKTRMTCRIERVGIGEGLVSLRISGQITAQDMDLKDLLLVDREPIKLPALRESNGVDLGNPIAVIGSQKKGRTGVRRARDRRN